MFKKTLSLFVSLVIAIGLCPSLAFADGQLGAGQTEPLAGQSADGDSSEASTQAASLRAKLDDRASYPIYYFEYLNKSKTQAVGITGEADGQGGVKSASVWYVTNSSVQWLYDSGYTAFYKGGIKLCTVKGGKIFKVEQGGYGSGSTSVAWFIKGGKATQIPTIGMNMSQTKGNQFTIVRQAFDTSYSNGTWYGHTWNAYYYRWNGKKFIEYGGKAVTQKQLKKAKNGASILKAIKSRVKKNEGVTATINSIYYRSNGIVNVNYSYKSRMSINHYNVKLKYSGGKLSYVEVMPNRPTALEGATQGGWYKARGGSESGKAGVTYPSKLPAGLR